jgi:hypothetical protein
VGEREEVKFVLILISTYGTAKGVTNVIETSLQGLDKKQKIGYTLSYNYDLVELLE